MNVSTKLFYRTMKILKIWEILKNKQQQILFSKDPDFFEFSQKNCMIWKKTLSGVYLYKISGKYLEKLQSFVL